jgi:signal transduction histidine kinase
MFNEASHLLTQNADKIMKNWEQRANREVIAALHLKSLALRDSLPELLSQISDALSTTIDRTSVRVRWDRQESLRIGQKHGRERAACAQYTMDQMIFEYHILRQVICDVLEEVRPLSDVEREVIVCAIEQAVNDAATQFSESLRAIQEQLAASLTHDLRGPLTSAKMNAQLLLRDPENRPLAIKAANRIASSMDRMDAMICDLLDVSVIRAGQPLPLKFEECDLDALVREIAEELDIIYGERFVVESKGQAKGFWSMSALRRVMENLATNAVKYGDRKTPITFRIDLGDSHVTLAVHNQGKPISPEDQAMLFNQFHRASSATGQTGWGLGLTVVKGLAEAHQGKIRVESQEGKGTTFTVELPRDSR